MDDFQIGLGLAICFTVAILVYHIDDAYMQWRQDRRRKKFLGE